MLYERIIFERITWSEICILISRGNTGYFDSTKSFLFIHPKIKKEKYFFNFIKILSKYHFPPPIKKNR